MAMAQPHPAPVKPLVLTVPGLNNSGPGHWQTLWEQQRDDCQRVDLGMWDTPHRNTWVNKLNLAIRAADRPVVLVAHSLGCLAVAWWAQLEQPGAANPADPAAPAHSGPLQTGPLPAGPLHAGKVRAALLVAPPEVDHRLDDPRVAGFAPMPRARLPFPAILVGSHNDHYMGLHAVEALARDWGCAFADAGRAGHINADSGLGDWAFGQFLLEQLIRRATPAPSAPAPSAPVPSNQAPSAPAQSNHAPSAAPPPSRQPSPHPATDAPNPAAR